MTTSRYPDVERLKIRETLAADDLAELLNDTDVEVLSVDFKFGELDLAYEDSFGDPKIYDAVTALLTYGGPTVWVQWNYSPHTGEYVNASYHTTANRTGPWRGEVSDSEAEIALPISLNEAMWLADMLVGGFELITQGIRNN